MKLVLLVNLKLLIIANYFLLNEAEHQNLSAGKYENANYCWHFHIYWQRKFHAHAWKKVYNLGARFPHLSVLRSSTDSENNTHTCSGTKVDFPTFNNTHTCSGTKVDCPTLLWFLFVCIVKLFGAASGEKGEAGTSKTDLRTPCSFPTHHKTCLFNFDTLKPHCYIVKLGFTGGYFIFLISAENIGCGYSLEPPRWGGSNEYPQSMFWEEIWKISEVFIWKFPVFEGEIFYIFE